MRVPPEPTGIAALIDALPVVPTAEARRDLRTELRQVAADDASVLVASLDHPDPTVRWEIVNLLGEIAEASTASAVVEFALRESEVHARWRSFWAATRFDRALTEPLLLDALSSASEPARWRAAVALSLLGRHEAVPRLVRGLDDADTWTVWEALSSLTALHPSCATAAIARLTAFDVDPSLRKQATLALGAIGGAEAARVLEPLIDDGDPAVRWRAVSGLARSGHRTSIGAIRRRADSEADITAQEYMRADLMRMEQKHGTEDTDNP